MRALDLPDLSGLREILANPKELAALLARIEAATATLNERLATTDTLESARKLESQAEAKLAEASEIRRKADDALSAARAEADRVLAEARETIAANQRDLNDLREALTSRAGDLAASEQRADAEVRAATAQQAEAASAIERAHQTSRDAMGLMARLQGQLARLRAVCQEIAGS